MRHTSSLPPLGAGQTLAGKFEILGVLGQGATGIVYDAVRTVEGDRIALKVIHPHLAGDAQIRGRFTREATILRRLEGEHLCPVLELGEAPDPRKDGAGLMYLALARIDGPALDTVIEGGRLPVARVVAIALDVCEALNEAHAQGVIHRDLKPGNVLLDGNRAVVVDFGLAKIMTGGTAGTTALTQHNVVFGTPEYMAPEQARGDELDGRCDVYAAGVILYELLAGTVPFTGASALTVLTAHMTTQPEPPRQRAPDREISPALEAVVLHALAKDPRSRYDTAAALATAICGALAAPLDVAAVRPVALAHAVVDSAGTREAITTPLVERPPSSGRPWLIVCALAALLGVVVGAWLSLRSAR